MNAAAADISITNSRWLPAYVGVGSNLAGPEAQVRRALDALSRLPGTRLIVSSPLYRTQPLTQSSPDDLLAQLRALERELGREPPRERWGPRVIDLDLLVVGRETRATAALTLPHPGIAERDFVLYPLADIAPDLDVPGVGRVAALKARVAHRGIARL